MHYFAEPSETPGIIQCRGIETLYASTHGCVMLHNRTGMPFASCVIVPVSLLLNHLYCANCIVDIVPTVYH